MLDKPLEDCMSLPKWMYLPRKSYDVSEGDKPVVLVANYTAQLLFDRATMRSHEAGIEPWSEMDRYWAKEHAAVMHEIQHGRTYAQYIPGKKYIATRIEDILSQHAQINRSRVAEIGCGSGIVLAELAAERGAKEVHGFDKSYGALQFFQFLAEQYGVVDQAKTKQGDFYSTGYKANQFDVVFNSGVFEHLDIEDQRRLIHEMLRILHPEGIVMVAVPNANGPLHKSSREREKNIFVQLVQNAIDYINPLSKYKYTVDLKELLETAGAKVLETGAISVVPSVPLDHEYLKNGLGEFYEKLPTVERWAEFPEDAFKFWKEIEKKFPQEVARFGWYHYIVGQKPKR